MDSYCNGIDDTAVIKRNPIGDSDYGGNYATQTSSTQIPCPFPNSRKSLKLEGLHPPQSSKVSSAGAPTLVDQFDPTIPIGRAVTPPSSWYTDPSFYSLELDTLFYSGWQAVGYTEQIKIAGEFFTGRLGNVEFVVCPDSKGKLQAFHNVCRHHASVLAYGSGRKSCFVCPYHEFGLIPVKVATWGPFVLLNMEQDVDRDADIVENEWLGSSSEILSNYGIDSSLSFVCRRAYTIECNWKVFCYNYLDGGYHVPYAHKGLASGLNLHGYSTTDDRDFIERSLKDSERVQIEDMMLCEGFQRGLQSPAYDIGRYAPTVPSSAPPESIQITIVSIVHPPNFYMLFSFFVHVQTKKLGPV